MRKGLLRTLLPIVLLLFFPGRGLADKPLALVEAARSQIGVTLFYDPAYRRLP